MSTHQIELSCETAEAEQFSAFLRAQGHTVTIGNSTGSYVDGTRTSTDPYANDALNLLWEQYCAG